MNVIEIFQSTQPPLLAFFNDTMLTKETPNVGEVCSRKKKININTWCICEGWKVAIDHVFSLKLYSFPVTLNFFCYRDFYIIFVLSECQT